MGPSSFIHLSLASKDISLSETLSPSLPQNSNLDRELRPFRFICRSSSSLPFCSFPPTSQNPNIVNKLHLLFFFISRRVPLFSLNFRSVPFLVWFSPCYLDLPLLFYLFGFGGFSWFCFLASLNEYYQDFCADYLEECCLNFGQASLN